MTGGQAIFLDRDGVLNRIVERDGKVSSPRTLGELEIEPDAYDALAAAKAAGFALFAVTNQPDVRRSLMDEADLEAIHHELSRRLPLDAIAICRHDNADNCACRKPKPGMLLDLAARWSLDLRRSWMIGDQARDMECSRAAGAVGVLLARPYNQGTAADLVVATLSEAIQTIIAITAPQRATGGTTPMFSDYFFETAAQALNRIDRQAVEAVAEILATVRERGGRLFLIGVGGSAGHASHATNDFRKICGFEAYCPTDNVSELTARINDEGWEESFAAWLAASRLRREDGLLIFSVGGGSFSPVSTNIVRAIQAAKAKDAAVVGIVGRDGGFTAQQADACVVIPTVDKALITPIAEGLAAVVWHLLVSHPKLAQRQGHWEQLAEGVVAALGE